MTIWDVDLCKKDYVSFCNFVDFSQIFSRNIVRIM